MYRVELKAGLWDWMQAMAHVPNVPCGVERCTDHGSEFGVCSVPNVPCGVERTVVDCSSIANLRS